MYRNIKIFYNKEVKLLNFKNISLKKKRKQILSKSFASFSFIMEFFFSLSSYSAKMLIFLNIFENRHSHMIQFCPTRYRYMSHGGLLCKAFEKRKNWLESAFCFLPLFFIPFPCMDIMLGDWAIILRAWG